MENFLRLQKNLSSEKSDSVIVLELLDFFNQLTPTTNIYRFRELDNRTYRKFLVTFSNPNDVSSIVRKLNVKPFGDSSVLIELDANIMAEQM